MTRAFQERIVLLTYFTTSWPCTHLICGCDQWATCIWTVWHCLSHTDDLFQCHINSIFIVVSAFSQVSHGRSKATAMVLTYHAEFAHVSDSLSLLILIWRLHARAEAFWLRWDIFHTMMMSMIVGVQDRGVFFERKRFVCIACLIVQVILRRCFRGSYPVLLVAISSTSLTFTLFKIFIGLALWILFFIWTDVVWVLWVLHYCLGIFEWAALVWLWRLR